MELQEQVRPTREHVNVRSDCAIGRTTFVNTLCGKRVLQGKDADDATNAHLEEGVRIRPVTVGSLSLSMIG